MPAGKFAAKPTKAACTQSTHRQSARLASGVVAWLGEDIAGLKAPAMRPRRRDMQIVFQDPLASLNPRMAIGEIIAEPVRAFYPAMAGEEVKARVKDMMAKVGLLPRMINRYPHEFSGGQCQRIGIARAMVLGPRLIVCDEPVSALDVSIQAQIINLLMDLQREHGLSLVFIRHDLSIVRHISHRIMVLYLGRVMELADRESLYREPRHPYTRALISAVPDPDIERRKRRIILEGDLPSPIDQPSGCVSRTRWPTTAARARRPPPRPPAPATRSPATTGGGRIERPRPAPGRRLRGGPAARPARPKAEWSVAAPLHSGIPERVLDPPVPGVLVVVDPLGDDVLELQTLDVDLEHQ